MVRRHDVVVTPRISQYGVLPGASAISSMGANAAWVNREK